MVPGSVAAAVSRAPAHGPHCERRPVRSLGRMCGRSSVWRAELLRHSTPRAAEEDGAAIAVARRSKKARYPELRRPGPQRLVVLPEACGFAHRLVRLRGRAAEAGWRRRWWALISLAARPRFHSARRAFGFPPRGRLRKASPTWPSCAASRHVGARVSFAFLGGHFGWGGCGLPGSHCRWTEKGVRKRKKNVKSCESCPQASTMQGAPGGCGQRRGHRLGCLLTWEVGDEGGGDTLKGVVGCCCFACGRAGSGIATLGCQHSSSGAAASHGLPPQVCVHVWRSAHRAATAHGDFLVCLCSASCSGAGTNGAKWGWRLPPAAGVPACVLPRSAACQQQRQSQLRSGASDMLSTPRPTTLTQSGDKRIAAACLASRSLCVFGWAGGQEGGAHARAAAAASLPVA